MANTKISQLPSYTGTAADLRWFVMNNSGETETFKYSGYSSQLIPGTGTGSFRTPSQTASGTNAIAIGTGAGASGNNSVSIGNSSSTNIGTDSIAIGRHPGLGGSNNTISIGSGAYNNTPYGIAIGHETSAQLNGICIGSNTTRATGSHSVSLGNAIENNIGTYSVVIGYNNRAGIAPTFNGNSYGVLIGSGHRAETTGFYNSILGGANNTISGTTSGTTLLGMTNYTPTRNDAAFAVAYVMTNYAALDFANDTAAAAGGVVLGQIYHHNGDMKIRIV
jgi:hypothetical protein